MQIWAVQDVRKLYEQKNGGRWPHIENDKKSKAMYLLFNRIEF